MRQQVLEQFFEKTKQNYTIYKRVAVDRRQLRELEMQPH
jgi:hypothetical protein